MSNFTFPGSELSIIYKGEFIYNKYYGNQTYPGDQYNIPIDDKTIYDMASVTKVVVATSCIMHLYDRGLLSIDD